MLAPVRVTKLGFDHVPSGFFTDTRPRPRRAPNTNPIFNVSGTTTIARASSSSLSGIADSGICWMSVSTRTALRARSSWIGPATVVAVAPKASRKMARRGRRGMADSGGNG